MAKKKKKAEKKSEKKKVAKPQAKAAKKETPKAKPVAKSGKARRSSWLDDEANVPVIEKSARRLESFLSAVADGIVDDDEVKAQEKRLVKLMKDIEPRLDDKIHADVTNLLIELTAYDMMQMICAMQKSKSQISAFRG